MSVQGKPALIVKRAISKVKMKKVFSVTTGTPHSCFATIDGGVQNILSPSEEPYATATVVTLTENHGKLVTVTPEIPEVFGAVERFYDKPPHGDVNSDNVKERDTTAHEAVLIGEFKNAFITATTPLSLGIETLGGITTRLIERNTPLPTRISQIFSTVSDNQTAVNIHVVLGEREFAEDNMTLGRFDLIGIPAVPRDVPQIEVTIDIDSRGLIYVSARDLDTGLSYQILNFTSNSPVEDNIENLVRDAEKHLVDDMKKRNLVDEKNNAESLIYQCENAITEAEVSIPEKDRIAIDNAIVSLREFMEGDDINRLKVGINNLERIFYKLVASLYKVPTYYSSFVEKLSE